MAEELSGVIILDKTEALAAVDELRSALDDALTGSALTFGDALSSAVDSVPTIEVEADASAVTPEVEGAVDAVDGLVPVDADAAAVTPEIEGAVDAAGSTVDVDADASGVTDAIESAVDDAAPALDTLGAAGESAGAGIGAGTSALEGLGIASLAVQGNASGAASSTLAMGGAATAATGGILAVATGVGALAKEAIEGAGAQQQFETATGAAAAAIRQVDVGTLNADLSDLALRVGSTDDQLFRATGTAFQFAEAFGFSSEESSTFAERIAALSARAVALRPDLGDVGDAANRLVGALASGREKALLPFNLGLTQTEIKAHAAELGIANVDGTVSRAALAISGADLAAQKFGDTMEADIARGAENPIIQQRALGATVRENIEALGAPLIVPVLDLMEAGIPVATAFGSALSTLGQSALPIVKTALVAVSGPLEFTATVIGELSPLIGPVVAGFIAFQAIAFLPALLTFVATTFNLVGASAVAAAIDTTAASVAMSATPIGLFAAGLAVVATALGVFGSAAHDTGEEVDFLSGATDRQIDALADYYATVAAGLGPDKAREESLRVLRDLADQNVAAAQRFGAALVDTGVLKQGEVNRVTDGAIEKQIQLKENTEASKAIIDAQGDSFDVAAAAADAYTSALDRSVNVNLDALTAQTQYIESLNTTTFTLAASNATLDLNTQAGRDNADSIASAASNAQAYAEAIIRQTGNVEAGKAVMAEFTQRLLDSVPAGSAARAKLEELLVSLGLLPPTGTAAAEGYGAAIGAIPVSTGNALGDALRTIQANGGLMNTTSKGVGDKATSGLKTGVAPIPGVAKNALQGAINTAAPLYNPAYREGAAIGASFSDGIAAGIRNHQYNVENAAREVVRAAARAAGSAGSPSEHLFYDQAIKWPAAMASAIQVGGSAVVAEAEAIVRAAAVGLPLPSAAASSSGSVLGLGGAGGGEIVITIEELRIVVQGVDDPSVAATVGEAAGNAAVTALTGAVRRRISNSAVTG